LYLIFPTTARRNRPRDARPARAVVVPHNGYDISAEIRELGAELDSWIASRRLVFCPEGASIRPAQGAALG